MKDRVIKNWRSSLVALLIVAACAAGLYFKYATWDQVIGFLGMSGLLAWAKDTIFKVKP